MERRATAILPMLSLVALLLVGAAVADDIIRLPGSDAAVMDETEPCCKEPVCSKRKFCYCADVFEDEECGGRSCGNCKAVKDSDPARYICRDASWGGPPVPECPKA